MCVMKLNIRLFIIALLLFASCSRGNPVRVVSLNIRYDNAADGGNRWDNRKEFLAEWLESVDADLVGLQEALWHQYQYIDSAIGDRYYSVAAGRNDGMRSGEMVPIFFRKERFSRIESGTFWLSETPAVAGSMGPGAVLPRIVTWARLFDEKESRELFFFNTHYSHVSDSARMLGSEILCREITALTREERFILTGDFNTTYESDAYRTLTGCSRGIVDTRSLTRSGETMTGSRFNGFSDISRSEVNDHIFASEGAEAFGWRIVKPKRGNLFISDHWPVTVTVTFGR